MDKPLILASGSKYRAQLLRRLGLPFSSLAQEQDETPWADDTPEQLARRLALDKARAIAMQRPEAWVIGSDQVASHAGRLLGKPGDRGKAKQQLLSFSGASVVFYTAVTLVHGAEYQSATDTTTVRFRSLDPETIGRYLDAEPAYDCAGSFKVEGLGISLFDAIESSDPTALVGLPLIALARMLRAAGFTLP